MPYESLNFYKVECLVCSEDAPSKILVVVELRRFKVRPRRTDLQNLIGWVGLSPWRAVPLDLPGCRTARPGDNPTQPMRICKSFLLGRSLNSPSSTLNNVPFPRRTEI